MNKAIVVTAVACAVTIALACDRILAADVPGPTAAEIMAKSDAAVGGSSVRTEIITISTTINGRYATIRMMMKRPDRFLERIRIPQAGATLTMAVDGSVAWIQGTDGQVHTVDAGDKNLGLEIVSTLYSTQRWKHVVRKPDRDYLGGTYFVLRTKPDVGPPADILIDKTSYYPIAVQAQFKGATFTEAFTDFARGPNGEAYPRHIRFHSPDGATMKEDTITSLDDNVPIDDGAFAPPR
jgi:hypothetical protein